MDAWGDALSMWDAGALDAWPERGIDVWPSRGAGGPLLPPLPAAEPAGAALGWVLEWPVAWLGDAAIESWGHWAARPRRSGRRSLRPRVYDGYGFLGYSPARRRRGGGALLMLVALFVVTLAGALTLGRGFPAVAQQLGALRDGATSVSGGIGASIGGAPDTTPALATPALTPPALGSDAQAFAALYGARFSASDTTAHYQTQLHGVAVALDVTFGLGTDRRDRVTTLGVGAASLAGWDAPTADAVCDTFLPPDAKLQGVAHVADDIEYRYGSASLATSFPQAYFVDDTYTLVAPGTLTRLDHPPLGSATGVGSCTLSLGAH